ncbi:WSC domain-domain-containing protein [Microdochium bolleyi]|uniref:WSC domain-domain-containing protein n=1 Tax=Microdochium bolleyi TaxID=196109 RepID=A0A136JE61_9PEZI|nr:WSC domain-domain-containing protein [Microdochium bolleyi]
MPPASAATSLSASMIPTATTAIRSRTTTSSRDTTSSCRHSNISHALLVLLAVLAVLTTQPALAAAQIPLQEGTAKPIPTSPDDLKTEGSSSTTADLLIFNYSSNYFYAGCYNDTNQLPNSTGAHALSHVLVGEGYLTAAMCLEWCAHNGTASLGRPYKFAGLEYSRECYCGDDLSSLVRKLDDRACNTPCDGDNTTACGGANKLSLYNITASALRGGAGATLNAAQGQNGAVLAVIAGLTVLFGFL